MISNDSMEQSVNITLDQLNDEKAMIYYGSVPFIGILFLPGVIGNIHVLHVYIFKKPNNTSRVYICVLAVIDFASCAVCFPFTIINCLYPLKFYNGIACKTFMCINYFLAISSALTLLAIAVERYRKICKPFKPQISLKLAKYSCAIVVTLSAMFSVPVIFLYGSTEIPTKHPNITGHECFIYTELQDTIYPTVFNGFLLFVSVGCCTAQSILYGFIGAKVWQQQAKENRMRSPSHVTSEIGQNREPDEESDQQLGESQATKITAHGISFTEYSVEDTNTETQPDWKKKDSSKNNTETQSDWPKQHTSKNNTETQSDWLKQDSSKNNTETQSDWPKQDSSKNNTETQSDWPKQDFSKNNAKDSTTKPKIPSLSLSAILRKERKEHTLKRTKAISKFNQMKKTTFMFFLITLFYILSYIPYPILKLYQKFNMEWYNQSTYAVLVVFNLSLCCIFINNAVNSFIYLICDFSYRQAVISFYRKLSCRK